MPRALRLSLLVVLPAALAVAADGKPPSTEDAIVAHVKDAKWSAPKVPGIPPGALVFPVAVDPASGGSVAYAKFPAGYSFPMHWHSATEYTELISGKVQFTIAGKGHELEPGSYTVIPPTAHHMLKCLPGADCVVLTRRAGPTDYNWVK